MSTSNCSVRGDGEILCGVAASTWPRISGTRQRRKLNWPIPEQADEARQEAAMRTDQAGKRETPTSRGSLNGRSPISSNESRQNHPCAVEQKAARIRPIGRGQPNKRPN